MRFQMLINDLSTVLVIFGIIFSIIIITVIVTFVNLIIKYNIFDIKTKTKSTFSSVKKSKKYFPPKNFFMMSCVISVGLILMINDGPNPCDIKDTFEINSSYDSYIEKPYIDLF